MRRLVPLIAVAVSLILAAIGYAAGRHLAAVPASHATAKVKLATLVVPDVRNEAFVFAKGQLQDDGFAWQVVGSVRGFAANMVASQSPAPGTKLLDTGAPLIKLTLAHNHGYAAKGEPEDVSPYAPTSTRVAGTE